MNLRSVWEAWFVAVYVAGGTSRAAEIVAASCSRADVQAALDAAVDGDTVVIPEGSGTWTNGLTLNKGIHLKGACGGRVEGSSASSRAIGTGIKSFAIRPGSVVSRGFSVGETVRSVYI